MRLSGVLLFHLNLCYSSISVARRAEVVERCYWPLLRLLDRVPGLRLAIEASGHTLEIVEGIDASWIERLRAEVQAGRVEFVGSGDTQLIGPLVPSSVNRWNQRLGQRTYERLLGCTSRTALVGEMAWSQGLVDHYLDAGYEAVVMEWNNPRTRHPEWNEEWRYRSVRTASPGGRQIGLHWADTTAFQKMQRVAFGEIDQEEYTAWVASQAGEGRTLFLYSGDAEIFDFRPGRYDTEPPTGEDSEWERIAAALVRLGVMGVRFETPLDSWRREAWRHKPLLRLTSCADPVPVKKQPKYNITRWALSGRDDTRLNARCFELAGDLEARDAGPDEWTHLCRLWSSDLRTHLSEDRWETLQAELGAEEEPAGVAPPPAGDAPASGGQLDALHSSDRPTVRRRGRRLELRGPGYELVLNTRRGLAIESLRFPELDPQPILGTLPHGTFDHIHWTADFYSGHMVFEIPGHRRVADLEPVEPRWWRDDDALVVEAEVPTALGPLPKRLRISADGLELAYRFSAWGPQPRGSLRCAHWTLFPEWNERPLEVRCAQGGLPESFALDGECEHGRGLSPFVSACAAFGATEGPFQLLAGDLRLDLEWRRDRAPVLPLLSRREIDGKWLTRIAFSLAEVDDTSRLASGRADIPLPDFELNLRPRRVRRPVCQ